MGRIKRIFVFGALLLFSACSTSMKTNIEKKYSPTPHSQNINVFGINDELPTGFEKLGNLKIRDTGFSTGCSLDEVVSQAQRKAREVGGNAIKITKIIEPDYFVSTCYRIDALIVRLKTFEKSDTQEINITEAELINYFDENKSNLKPIEGIWNVNSRLSAKTSDQTRLIQNRYKIAIIKKDFEDSRNFKAIIISSEDENWDKTGLVKANLSSTAYEDTYTTKWINANGTKSNSTFSINENGLAKGYFDKSNFNEEMTLVKIYPEFDSNKISAPKGKASGTGFAISKNGVIVTNYHVIKDANDIELIFNSSGTKQSQKYKAEVLLNDKSNDISILKINDPSFSNFAEIPFGITSTQEIGDDVYTIGYPLNEIMGSNFKLSKGVINSKTGIDDDARYLQVSVPVQPGNSGGPLFNMNGNVIGIITSSLNDEAVKTKVENVNYAIKTDYLAIMLNMLPDISKPEPSKDLQGKKLSDQVDVLKKYVCLINVTY
ncbi:serine protease [Fodinibius sp.]|uniref:S1C family serine protease n=1 Tax=Fodinibius sp. TaxID=1872440 RepID=UPI002ACDDDFA|nr:serine protease [Fodinibius sp.]MDZ7658150.1 serine protease [Fodinibius sp.]